MFWIYDISRSVLCFLIAALIAVSATVPCLAAGAVHPNNIVYDLGGWQQFVAEGSLGIIDPRVPKMRIWLEGQVREDNNFRNVYQGLVRVAMGYQLNDRATIWAGYNYAPSTVVLIQISPSILPNKMYGRHFVICYRPIMEPLFLEQW